MSQMSFTFNDPPAWSVTELTRYVRDLLESDRNLQDVWVKGEISNLTTPRSGHIYFTLKDSNAALKCVMWKNAAQKMRFMPRDGDAVEVYGAISVYEPGGQYQMYATIIRHAGEGLLYQEFIYLKNKLEAEGLFEPGRKRPIPALPRRIGIVTSPTGAALQDMLNTIRRRYPLVEVILAPTLVQGEQAPAGIIASLEALNQFIRPDLIILARGGGSIEDLWAFNDEAVARAIAESAVPVITGVGHETDFTIADFVADLRAPTPTAAAELATPNRDELSQFIEAYQDQLTQAIASVLSDGRWTLAEWSGRLRYCSPAMRIRSDQQRVDELGSRLDTSLNHMVKLNKLRLQAAHSQLTALNPLAVLGRGFALLTGEDGSIIRSTRQVAPGKAFRARLVDGSFTAQVSEDPSND